MERKKEKSKIDELRQKLYQRNFRQNSSSVRPSFYAREAGVAKEWLEDTQDMSTQHKKKKSTFSFFQKMLLGSILFFVLALGFSGFMFWGGSNMVSPENVSIEILGPTAISGGEELALQVVVTNNNSTALKFTDLVLKYPEGTYDPKDTTIAMPRFRKALGIIQPGESVTEIVRAVVFGQEGSDKEIVVEVEYRVEGSNAIFVKDESYALSVSSAPVHIAFEMLGDVNDGQEADLSLRISSNSDTEIKDAFVRVEYPFGFEPRSFNPEPDLGNNIWALGDISPSSETQIKIGGVMHGQEGDSKTFRAFVGKQDNENERELATVYSSALAQMNIREPIMGATISLDGEMADEYAVNAGNSVDGTLSWANNLSTRVEDVVVELSLSGDALDKSSVFADRGVYNSSQNKIIWDKRTYPAFASVEPGEKGRLNFKFASDDLFALSSVLSNPQIYLNVSIKGRAVAEGNIAQSVEEFVRRVVKINSDLQISARAVHTTGPFSNVGPLPPQADNMTTYTIIWTVVNSSSDISRASAVATIPSYAAWLGTISPQDEKVSFDSATGEITWSIGKIRAGAGSAEPARELAFQISVVPSISHIGNTLQIISDVALRGTDNFTGALLSAEHNALNTYLTSDPGFIDTWAKVVE